MIKVNMDLVPLGVGPPRSLGAATIVNDGTGSPTSGNYKVTFYSAGKNPRVWRSVEVKNFPRKKLSAWFLLATALQIATGREENT